MADRLTQLQDCLDDLLMQMFATLSYINTHHPYGEIPGQPDMGPQANGALIDDPASAQKPTINGVQPAQQTIGDTSAIKSEPMTPQLDTPADFQNALRELARDLVVQEQKAEYIINHLPGLGNSERDQRERMQELGHELKEASEARQKAEGAKKKLIHDLNKLVAGVRRPK